MNYENGYGIPQSGEVLAVPHSEKIRDVCMGIPCFLESYAPITNYKKKIKKKNLLGPILVLFKIGLIFSIWLYSKQQKLLNQNLF